MEEELKCQVCKQLFTNPVLLPCYHAICFNCSVQIQSPVLNQNSAYQSHPHSHATSTNFHGHSHHIVVTTATVHVHHQSDTSISSNSVDGGSESSGTEDCSDKISILSETDSGVVVCNSSSRPGSYSGTHHMHGLLFPPIVSTVYSLACPVCHKLVCFDEGGTANLPKYRVMQNIVDKYVESRSLGVKCQLCEKSAKGATVWCETCEIFYCDSCRESCHPPRGPLATHTLLPFEEGKKEMRRKSVPLEYKCPDHREEKLSYYCLYCKIPICGSCRGERKHIEHEIQPIGNISKAQKTELSHNLQQLSEKAKSGTEFIQRLKAQTEKVNENCSSMESVVSSQIDSIIELLRQRKEELISFIRREKEYKIRSLKTEVTSHTQRLQQTTALIQFCIEALKETDPSAYLQVGSLLLARVSNLEGAWQSDEDLGAQNMQILPSSKHKSKNSALFNPDFDLTLDDRSILAAIRQLNFIQMKPAKDGEERKPAAPGPVIILREECSAENNSVTIAWQPPPTSFVEGYVLEIDDGARGPFREVYCGKETICTVDGLHFNSIYNARVRAFNSTGEGEYSVVISLQTAEVAWFSFDPLLAPQGVRLTGENMRVTSDSYEPRVILGTVGFGRGVHYWEYYVEKYDASADPSFGIARLDVRKEEMLGKDEKGWGMYIDHQRSWFMNSGVHLNRTEGGIGQGSTVGVCLDLDKKQLTFYVNDEQQGPVAFKNLYGIFYPAVSINCNVTLTLRTSLDPPSDYDKDSGTCC